MSCVNIVSRDGQSNEPEVTGKSRRTFSIGID